MFYGIGQLLHALHKHRAGNGHVEAHKTIASLAKHRPVVEADAGLIHKQVDEPIMA